MYLVYLSVRYGRRHGGGKRDDERWWWWRRKRRGGRRGLGQEDGRAQYHQPSRNFSHRYAGGCTQQQQQQHHLACVCVAPSFHKEEPPYAYVCLYIAAGRYLAPYPYVIMPLLLCLDPRRLRSTTTAAAVIGPATHTGVYA